jgi:RecB family exonuclease
MTEELWLSYSSLGAHRSCPQAWHYARIKKLQRLVTEPAVERDFGTWWHALRAADSLERGRKHDSLCKIPEWIKTTDDNGPVFNAEHVVPSDVLAASAVFFASRSEEERAMYLTRLGGTLDERLADVYRRWQMQWAHELEHEHPMAVEMGWRRRLTAADSPQPVMLVGYVDEVFYDARHGVIVARDHKTAKELSTQSVGDDMMDSQLQLYAWGAASEVNSWGKGGIRAIAYDRVRSVAPKPPLLTLSGRLRLYNGQPGLGQCDLETYLEWTREGVPFEGTKGTPPGLYHAEPAIIERLSAPSHKSTWFQRTLTPLNPNLIRVHLRSALDTATDVARTTERVAEHGEAPRNLGYACRWCDFAKLCRAQMIGGPEGDYLLADYNLMLKPE